VTVADKDHLHHRLMRLGHGQRRSVLILWAWTVLLSAIVLYPTYHRGQGDLYIPVAIAVAALLLYTWFGPGVRSRRETEDAES
jgi:UDP-GlcNAc:undecaprenyl-phosphate GlcNAc-1-phosphate transferase